MADYTITRMLRTRWAANQEGEPLTIATYKDEHDHQCSSRFTGHLTEHSVRVRLAILRERDAKQEKHNGIR